LPSAYEASVDYAKIGTRGHLGYLELPEQVNSKSSNSSTSAGQALSCSAVQLVTHRSRTAGGHAPVTWQDHQGRADISVPPGSEL
jgi:hypothetical protein